MASIKLLVHMRDGIVKRVLEHRFSEAGLALRERWSELAQDFYEDVFLPAFRNQMDRVPEGWLPKVDRIKVQVAGQVRELHLDGSCIHIKAGAQLPDGEGYDRLIPYNRKGAVLAVYDAAHPLSGQLERLAAQTLEHNEAYESVLKMVRATVDSFSTVGALENAWPEVKPFTAMYHSSTRQVSLPMIQVAELNAACALP